MGAIDGLAIGLIVFAGRSIDRKIILKKCELGEGEYCERVFEYNGKQYNRDLLVSKFMENYSGCKRDNLMDSIPDIEKKAGEDPLYGCIAEACHNLMKKNGWDKLRIDENYGWKFPPIVDPPVDKNEDTATTNNDEVLNSPKPVKVKPVLKSAETGQNKINTNVKVTEEVKIDESIGEVQDEVQNEAPNKSKEEKSGVLFALCIALILSVGINIGQLKNYNTTVESAILEIICYTEPYPEDSDLALERSMFHVGGAYRNRIKDERLRYALDGLYKLYHDGFIQKKNVYSADTDSYSKEQFEDEVQRIEDKYKAQANIDKFQMIVDVYASRLD